MKIVHYFSLCVSMFLISSCEKDSNSFQEKDSNVITNQKPNKLSFLEDGSQLSSSEKRFSFFPDLISFDKEGVYPEGVEFDFRRNQFLVSSINYGDIGAVTPDGKYSTFIKDDILTSSLGLHIDNIRDRLYVAIANISGEKTAIVGYDLKTKKRVLYTDLTDLVPGPSLANDLITDYSGNIYVTDSYASVIYKVSPNGEASVFIEDEVLVSNAGIGLNGITFNPFGFLLVASSNKDVLFKIPIEDPKSLSILDLGIGGIDGIQITDFNTIYAVAGGNMVYKLRSTDNFNSIEIVNSFETLGKSPTTVANTYFGSVYVIHSFLLDYVKGTQPPINTFNIQKVPF